MIHLLKKLSIPFTVSLLSLVLLLTHSAGRDAAAQTIPSRTPTPSGGGATATGEPGDPGPNPTAPPTSTNRPPQNTSTATPFVLPPTPEDGFLPTAQPCGLEVTARALSGNTNVRSGPGLAYNVVGRLVAMEVRPVTGRAPEIAWWQIILADGVLGWVSDDLVEISGYIDLVPIITPPPVDQTTVTPGPTWEPTPRPQCTPPPTSTSTATATPDATPTSTATPEGITAGQMEGETAEDGTAQASPEATQTRVQATETAPPLPTTPAPTAAPLPGEQEASAEADTLWIPMAGIALILTAAGLFIARRVRT